MKKNNKMPPYYVPEGMIANMMPEEVEWVSLFDSNEFLYAPREGLAFSNYLWYGVELTNLKKYGSTYFSPGMIISTGEM